MNKYEKNYKDAIEGVSGLMIMLGSIILIGVLVILGLLNPIINWIAIGVTWVVALFYFWVLHGQITEARLYKQLVEMEEDPEEES